MKRIKSFYKCMICGDEIYVNTNSKLIFCKCGQMGIDGNEYYVRVIGDGETKVIVK